MHPDYQNHCSNHPFVILNPILSSWTKWRISILSLCVVSGRKGGKKCPVTTWINKGCDILVYTKMSKIDSNINSATTHDFCGKLLRRDRKTDLLMWNDATTHDIYRKLLRRDRPYKDAYTYPHQESFFINCKLWSGRVPLARLWAISGPSTILWI